MKVIVIGTLAFDQIMSMPSRFGDYIQPDKIHMLNISFHVDSLKKSFGGSAGNQGYNLGLLGLRPVLVAAAGRDFEDYKKKLMKAGVDVSRVVQDKNKLTANAFAVTDQDDNQIWSFYQGAATEVKKTDLIKIVSKEDMVMLAPCDPKSMIKFISQVEKIKPRFMFDPAFYIPELSKEDLIKGIELVEVVIGNDYEVSLLLKKTGLTKEQVLAKVKVLVTTLGSKGSVIEIKNKSFKIPIAKPKNTSDPAGAGDAYRAGFVTGYLKKLPLKVCGQMGAVVAAYTVEKYGTQTHSFSIKQFKDRYKQNFGETLNW